MGKNFRSVLFAFIRFSFALAFLLAVNTRGGVSQTIDRPEVGSMTLDLLAPVYQVEGQSDGASSIQAEGFPRSAAPGEPALPRRVLQLALPPLADLDSVSLEITALEVEPLPGTYEIQAVPLDSPENASFDALSSLGVVQPNTTASFARLLSTGQMRKWRFASLEHAPFAYDPLSRKLSVASRLQITLRYRLEHSAMDAALLADDLMDDLAQSRFYNYDLARAWYPAVEAPGQPAIVYDYVIITTNAIEAGSSKLADFVQHKRNRGFSVLTITEDEYGGLTGQAPNGTAEKIRKWLKDNYISFGIKYVLLVGNPDPDDPSLDDAVGDLPMKMCWPRRLESMYREAPTDYYYADLTGNWDKDGDGYFGEWGEDTGSNGVDFAPEVYIGRIPVYSADYSTLDSILQKIIDYENEANPLSWRKQALLPMSFSLTYYDGAPLAEQIKDDYLNGAGFSSWTQYQQGSGACSLDSIYASSEELRGGTVVRDRWAANDYGLVLWWGHGSSTEAAVGCENCWDGTLFKSSQTPSLDDDHPSFVYQNSCDNGYPEDPSNLQYALLKGGAVATVGATRVSFFNTGEGYGDFDGSSTNSGIGYEYASRLIAGQTAAEALYNAKSGMVAPKLNSRLMNFYDFNLYGDPATYLLPPMSPSAFSKASPDNNAINQPASLEISWQATSPSSRYEYCYDTTHEGSCDSWTNIGLSTSANLSGLSKNTTYYWQVRAWNGQTLLTYANNGDWWQFTVGGEQVYLPVVMRGIPAGFIQNSNFEQGPEVGWQEYSSNGNKLIVSSDSLAVPPHSGNWAAWLGGANNEYSTLEQQVIVPSPNPILTFWYWIDSQDWCDYDSASVMLGAVTLVNYELCSANGTGGWVQQSLDLGAYAGQTQVLKFVAQTDGSLNSNFFLDDIAFGGSGALSTAPTVSYGQPVKFKGGN